MKNLNRSKIKAFLVDDNPIVREGVRTCLTEHGSFSVVGEAADNTETLRKVKKLVPDVILIDINLPSIDGGELARKLRQAVPGAKIIAFSIHDTPEYVVRMAHCGAHGCVIKNSPSAKLTEAIRHVHGGGLYFPTDMADAILAPATVSSETSDVSALTTREREVLTKYAIQQGLTSL